MEILIGGLILFVIFIIYLFTLGYKCPECGNRTKEVQSSKTIDWTTKKKDGSRDERYNKVESVKVTIKCKKEGCENVFETDEKKSLLGFSEAYKRGSASRELGKRAKERLSKMTKQEQDDEWAEMVEKYK